MIRPVTAGERAGLAIGLAVMVVGIVATGVPLKAR